MGKKQTLVDKVGARAEWDPAKVILMHEPGIEADQLALHWVSSLYEGAVDVDAAQEEHRNYVRELRQTHGAEVYLVRQVLEELADIGALRSLAAKQLQYEGQGMLHRNTIKKRITEGEKTNPQFKVDPNYNYGNVKTQVIRSCSRRRLVDIILTKPTIHWDGGHKRGSYAPAVRSTEPLGNLLFTRDQMITTAKGVVLSRMRHPQRAIEVDIMEVVLKTLGVKPIYRVQDQEGGGFIEGGDYFSMGDFCLLGIGSRSDYNGAKQLIDNDVFGFDTVVLVDDMDSDQSRMHLDTYYNVPCESAGVIQGNLSSRSGFRRKGDPNSLAPVVEIWYKQNGVYKRDKDQSGQGFTDFLEGQGHIVIPMPAKVQANYGLNFLNVGGNRIIGVPEETLGTSRKKYAKSFLGRVQRELVTSGRAPIILNEVPYRHCNNMFGGQHCTTQVIYRQAPGK
jgi:arginine deiminase